MRHLSKDLRLGTLGFHTLFFVCFSFIATAISQATEWKIGVAKVSITPEVPIHLVGYDIRDAPFSRVDIDIYAKALAFKDKQGNRGILVTADIVGFLETIFEPVCERIMKTTGLSREQIMLNASHNHTGPLMSLKPGTQGSVSYSALNEKEALQVVEYTKTLQEKIYRLVLNSLDDLQPAELSWGTDRVSFVMNRRIQTKAGTIRMGPNPEGPVDSIVPVLKVTGPKGDLRALLFGCACHNTGLTADHNLISGDYAGYAQEILERRYPGTVALFKSGCGADANPEPRTDISGVRILGLELADAVTRVLESNMKPIQGELKCVLRMTELPLKTFSPEQVKVMAADTGVIGLMAKQMWKVLESGGTLRNVYSAPIAAWSFGDDLTIVAFPSETVSEYALNLRANNPNEPLWVSGYNNTLMGYIPTAQIVREGGHETLGVATWLWGTDLADHVGFFREEVEQVMMNTAQELLDELKEVSTESSQ